MQNINQTDPLSPSSQSIPQQSVAADYPMDGDFASPHEEL